MSVNGNYNAIRHGLRSSRLPPGCSYIRRCLDQFRRSLEQAVIDHRGELGLVDASLVNTAIRHERHAQLCQRWLALDGERMTIEQRVMTSRDIGRASDSRDKAIERLGLTPLTDRDLWAEIHQQPQLPSPVATSDTESDSDVTAPTDASEAKHGVEKSRLSDTPTVSTAEPTTRPAALDQTDQGGSPDES